LVQLDGAGVVSVEALVDFEQVDIIVDMCAQRTAYRWQMIAGDHDHRAMHAHDGANCLIVYPVDRRYWEHA
jgi:hypothetical protein